MLEKTVFIDGDFMPPTAERFCLIPEAVKAGGYDSLCIKIIDNYPWSFDCRMQSDSAYDEKVLDFLSNKCLALGLKLFFVFPAEDSYSRLLRQNGYKRMMHSTSRILKIDPDAVGFSSLIESVLDDFYSLCPGIASVVADSVSDNNEYTNKVSSIIKQSGYNLITIEDSPDFTTASRFLEGLNSKPDNYITDLYSSQNSFLNAVFDINRFLTMSSLSRSLQASDSQSLSFKYSSFLKYKKELEAFLQKFKTASAGKVDSDWLEIYVNSITLTINDNSDRLNHRLRQFGLLN